MILLIVAMVLISICVEECFLDTREGLCQDHVLATMNHMAIAIMRGICPREE